MAIVSDRRSMSYRKLWSRIERATARVQQEWGIGEGDTAGYWGNGHPDAIVLYVALARSGARLLPLEHGELRHRFCFLSKEFRLKMLLHDDDIILPENIGVLPVKPLSALIENRCPCQPRAIIEDIARPSMIFFPDAGQGELQSSQYSLSQMSGRSQEGRDMYPGGLFGVEFLAQHVLPTLAAGNMLVLR